MQSVSGVDFDSNEGIVEITSQGCQLSSEFVWGDFAVQMSNLLPSLFIQYVRTRVVMSVFRWSASYLKSFRNVRSNDVSTPRLRLLP